MPNNAQPTPDELQTIWSGFAAEQPRLSAAEIRARAAALHNTTRRRALISALVIVVGFGNPIAAALLNGRPLPAWERILMVYMVVVAAAILWMSRAARAGFQPAADCSDGSACLRYYRSMLETQRDQNRGRMLTMRLIALVVAVAVVAAVSMWAQLPAAAVWPFALAVPVLAAFTWYRSTHRARFCQSQLDVLDRSLQS